MLSPGNNVGKKVGRTTTLRLFESFRPPFSKGGAHPRRVALVAARRRRNPLNGIFFLLSFFFCACYGQKKKRRSLFADIISVYEAAFSAAPSGREHPLRRYRGSSRSYTEPPTQRGIRKQKYPVRNNLTGYFLLLVFLFFGSFNRRRSDFKHISELNVEEKQSDSRNDQQYRRHLRR